MPKVKVREIQADMRDIEVTGRIVRISERRHVQTKYGPADVVTATLQDETGSIDVSLWKEQIDSVHENETVKIINGFVRSYRDRPQLNIGRNGQIIIVG